MTGGWTKGPWAVEIMDNGYGYAIMSPQRFICSVAARGAGIRGTSAKAKADAALIAEAGTVANETGLSPRQLAEQNKELSAALDSTLKCFDIKDGLSIRDEMAIKHAAAVIAKCTGAA